MNCTVRVKYCNQLPQDWTGRTGTRHAAVPKIGFGRALPQDLRFKCYVKKYVFSLLLVAKYWGYNWVFGSFVVYREIVFKIKVFSPPCSSPLFQSISLLNLILRIPLNAPMQWSPRSKHSKFSKVPRVSITEKQRLHLYTATYLRVLHISFVESTVKSIGLVMFFPVKFTNTMATSIYESSLEQCRAVRSAAVDHPGWQVANCMPMLSITSEKQMREGKGRERMHS